MRFNVTRILLYLQKSLLCWQVVVGLHSLLWVAQLAPHFVPCAAVWWPVSAWLHFVTQHTLTLHLRDADEIVQNRLRLLQPLHVASVCIAVGLTPLQARRKLQFYPFAGLNLLSLLVILGQYPFVSLLAYSETVVSWLALNCRMWTPVFICVKCTFLIQKIMLLGWIHHVTELHLCGNVVLQRIHQIHKLPFGFSQVLRSKFLVKFLLAFALIVGVCTVFALASRIHLFVWNLLLRAVRFVSIEGPWDVNFYRVVFVRLVLQGSF